MSVLTLPKETITQLFNSSVSSGSLKRYKETNQVERVMAFAWSLKLIEYFEEEEVFGWYVLI